MRVSFFMGRAGLFEILLYLCRQYVYSSKLVHYAYLFKSLLAYIIVCICFSFAGTNIVGIIVAIGAYVYISILFWSECFSYS